jgi:hypothetical protein
MTIDAAKALRYETEFLSGVESNFEAAKGVHFRGSKWQHSHQDEGDRVQALLASKQRYDRELLKTLPLNRRVEVRGFEKRFGLWKRGTGVAIASVISPLGHFAAPSGNPPPIGLAELMEHVRRLVRDTKVPHIIGVCSTTGFTEEARMARIEMPHVTVVLVEPEPRGGWRVHGSDRDIDPRLVKIFDPEGPKQKVERVRRVLQERSADLLTGGLSASSVAEKANLPEDTVRRAFEALAESDPEMRVMREDGELVLFRGAPVVSREKKMNMMDRIRQLFSGEGDENAKINLLAERRAALARRRDRIYDDIAKLEEREADLLEQGKAAKSQVPRRRLAAQLAQLRKDIARQNTTAAMLNQQINIISTDIHNLTLVRQGKAAQLPSSEELTENAVRAEEMLETLKGDADLVQSLEVGIEASMTNAEEEAILREFEAADRAESPPAPSEAAPTRKGAQTAAPQERAAPSKPMKSEDEWTEADAPVRDQPETNRGRDAEAT